MEAWLAVAASMLVVAVVQAHSAGGAQGTEIAVELEADEAALAMVRSHSFARVAAEGKREEVRPAIDSRCNTLQLDFEGCAWWMSEEVVPSKAVDIVDSLAVDSTYCSCSASA